MSRGEIRWWRQGNLVNQLEVHWDQSNKVSNKTIIRRKTKRNSLWCSRQKMIWDKMLLSCNFSTEWTNYYRITEYIADSPFTNLFLLQLTMACFNLFQIQQQSLISCKAVIKILRRGLRRRTNLQTWQSTERGLDYVEDPNLQKTPKIMKLRHQKLKNMMREWEKLSKTTLSPLQATV